MAFLMRLAATKEGSDRLLASQLLSRLSRCAYFDIESYVSNNDLGKMAVGSRAMRVRSYDILIARIRRLRAANPAESASIAVAGFATDSSCR